MFAFSMIVGYSNEYAKHIRAFVVLNSGCILEQVIALKTPNLFLHFFPAVTMFATAFELEGEREVLHRA